MKHFSQSDNYTNGEQGHLQLMCEIQLTKTQSFSVLPPVCVCGCGRDMISLCVHERLKLWALLNNQPNKREQVFSHIYTYTVYLYGYTA